MLMNEPKLEFVALNMSEIVTGNSGCTDPEKKQDASILICDCTNAVNEDVTQDCSIV